MARFWGLIHLHLVCIGDLIFDRLFLFFILLLASCWYKKKKTAMVRLGLSKRQPFEKTLEGIDWYLTLLSLLSVTGYDHETSCDFRRYKYINLSFVT